MREKDSVTGLTRKQIEFLELINMGVPSFTDAARALGISISSVSMLNSRITRDHPDYEIEMHNLRKESAIDMRERGYLWREIAEQLHFKEQAVCQNVQRYCEGKPWISNIIKKRS